MQQRSHNANLKYLLAGGSVVAAFGLLIDPRALLPPTQPVAAEVCQEIVQRQARLSRSKLSRLLTVPERSNKAAVRQIVQTPYCTLPPLRVRSGPTAQREAYPLEFDPQTWLIVLYEDNEYAGYSFSFRH
ncbi:hypothetical protein H6F43_16465 [Leptolyngbya sp. FACHB-36]|uniref:hypothetical protein n=1 Tax=Leptolyngbya sp. FACHB-36 TaxID=2692808 RepID=UPI001680073D|nr:hypothetical protein [Leptolyngbya sp. FACHB-36]MBD2021775.1 hypothetical protein [Leptolyngbya sp. FACHB-36]